jgi:hypothetical protein
MMKLILLQIAQLERIEETHTALNLMAFLCKEITNSGAAYNLLRIFNQEELRLQLIESSKNQEIPSSKIIQKLRAAMPT